MLRIAKAEEIPLNGGRVIMVGGTPVALFNINGEVLAWDNCCPHRGSSLADGDIEPPVIRCKNHLWDFDIDTGQAVANPSIKVRIYPLDIKNGEVYIDEKEL